MIAIELNKCLLRPMIVGFMWLAFGLINFHGSVVAQQNTTSGKPIPFDLAFHRHELTDIVLSPDGKLVAYSVHIAPDKVSQGGEYYLPNGVPTSIANRILYIADVATGKQTQVGTNGVNSWRPAFSRDGSQLAFYSDKGDAAHLWIYDLKTRKARQLKNIIVKPQLWIGDEPQWSPDGKEIFVPESLPKPAPKPEAKNDGTKLTVTVRLAGDELPKTANKKDSNATIPPTIPPLWQEFHTTIVAVNTKTGSVRTVVPSTATPTPNVLEVSPSGKWVLYVSLIEQKSLQKMSLFQTIAMAPANGGPVRTVVPEVPMRMGALKGSFSMHPQKDQIFWIKDGKLWTVNLTTGPLTPKSLIPDYDLSPTPISFTSDGNAIVAGIHSTADKSNAGFRMAVIPLNGSDVVPIEVPAGTSLTGFLRKGNGATLWQPQTDTILAFGRDNKTGESIYAEVNIRTGSSNLLWKGDKSPYILGAGPSGTWVGIYGDVNSPADLFRVSSDFKNNEKITHLEPRLDNVTFGSVETFTTSVTRYDGGKEVTSAIVLPPGAKRGDKLPTVVIVYPRSMGMPASALSNFAGGDAAEIPAAIYATNGYAVLLTQCPIRPVGQAGGAIINDILSIIEPQVRHAIELGYVDENRIAVSGHSFGGYSTAALLCATNLFKAGIANAGAYNLPFDDYYMNPSGGYFSEEGKTQDYWNMSGDLWQAQKEYIDASPFFRADKISSPLLMIHGTDDKVCSIEDARLMFNALRHLKKTVQLAEYTGEGHFMSNWSLVNITDAAKRAIAFLDKYVKPVKTTN